MGLVLNHRNDFAAVLKNWSRETLHNLLQWFSCHLSVNKCLSNRDQQHHEALAGLYPAVCFREEYNSQRGTIEWPKAFGHESRHEAPSWGRIWGGGVPLPRDGVRDWHPENFEIWDAIWCNLVHFGKKLTFLQLSTFVNENIIIVLDSGIDSNLRF